MPFFVDVALDVPLHQTFTYRAEERLAVGAAVQVPWRNRTMTGIVVRSYEDVPNVPYKIRRIASVVDRKPMMSAAMAEMLLFMSVYYHEPIGLCMKLALPQGFVRAGECSYVVGDNLEKLRPDEKEAFESVRMAIESGEVTGRKICARTKCNYDLLDDWVERGLLSVEWFLDKKRREETKVTYVKLVDGEEPKRCGARQKAVLEVLREMPEVPLKFLNQRVEGAGAAVRRLAELGKVSLVEVNEFHSSFEDIAEKPKEVQHTVEQEEAIAAVLSAEGFRGFLLHGVTGSGKTEVYMSVMSEMRRRGKGCLLILPEIALTPQFCAIFRGKFGDEVAVLHSQLGEPERYDAWARLRSGQYHIAIGARSALFAPVQDLGVIVVDEEHDGSFKQGESPRYQCRDMALVLGQKASCPVILGSATPSLESYAKAQAGRLTLLTLTQRPCARPMPEVGIIDMRSNKMPCNGEISEGDSGNSNSDETDDRQAKLEKQMISAPLRAALADTLERHEQAIILLNRRGFSTFVQCSYCGYAVYCPHCAVSMTYHRYGNVMRCHYCDYEQPVLPTCPKCGRPDIGMLGFGTERLVTSLGELLPGARIDRLDRDRANAKGLRNVLSQFREGKLDILVGTQMVAKGHDIHNVTLVGVVCADLTLNLPDFRSSERTFQLLTQVSGRAGRGERPGKVMVQSYLPEHPVLQFAMRQDYAAFALHELKLRKALDYPPFTNLVMWRFESADGMAVDKVAQMVGRVARRRAPQGATVLGPAPSPIVQLRGKVRYQLIFKCAQRPPLHAWLQGTLDEMESVFKKYGNVAVLVDVDPVDMM